MPRIVFPQPALPQIKLGRPFGRPPSVISSRPRIPVRDFASDCSVFVLFKRAPAFRIAWYLLDVTTGDFVFRTSSLIHLRCNLESRLVLACWYFCYTTY